MVWERRWVESLMIVRVNLPQLHKQATDVLVMFVINIIIKCKYNAK